MKKVLIASIMFACLVMVGYAQKSISVPAVVKAALIKKYPEASKATWEKEKGNYEANWGGRSGEANAVTFTPAGEFIEIVNKEIPLLYEKWKKKRKL